MPPAMGEHAHDPLKQEEIKLIKEWIRQGAEWEEHWSYIPPVKQDVLVNAKTWIRQPMDTYVLQRLEKEGLSPSSAAPRAQWLRRVSFDLIGLPPTVDELKAFEGDSSEDAYEQVVDRLLASPRYGERWASMWMDLARYADTVGYEKDIIREMWPYRNWLIDAFNRDLPYPQFVRDQIAGDLLKEPTTEQLMATGFLRLTPTNTEGGTDDEEFRVAAIIDRVNTTWAAFQGLSFACVQCHGHPYEPIPHEDYYRFMDLFNSTEDCDLKSEFPRHLRAHNPEQQQLATNIQLELLALNMQQNQPGSDAMLNSEQWLPVHYSKLSISSGTLQQDGDILFTNGTQRAKTEYELHLSSDTSIDAVTAIKLSILPDSEDLSQGPFRGALVSQFILSKHATNGSSTNLPLSYVYVDYLAGPYDPQQALKPGAPGVGGYPKLFQEREAVFVLRKAIKLSQGETLKLRLQCHGSTSGGQNVALRKFKLMFSSSDQWPNLLNRSEHILRRSASHSFRRHSARSRGNRFRWLKNDRVRVRVKRVFLSVVIG